ncbi:hypothetical protein N3K66_008784 [Trichothecium roseum]|uniref:Uncharacterized protein n=1 Tax=Trichothecium roseum TaxID=47278 RepID=A0ACC0UTP9_9HYPO|nr:hypothetical protein N3K66_008784 [Trichothecium roseum]
MEYRPPPPSNLHVKPRLIIHGGAGNIRRPTFPPEKYDAYRHALLTVVSRTNDYINAAEKGSPSALDIAAHAVTQLEDHPIFNAGHGAVFTRDGLNELEASVMVSRGQAKRAVGVMGLRRVRNPITLAKAILERGDKDILPKTAGAEKRDLNVPSAQGHTLVHGETAEQLASAYGFPLVKHDYFFTQQRWDEHIRGLENEAGGSGTANWSADEYLPQGTVGAVALDSQGVICVATSTGGLTNKLTGRVGDTPVPGAGYWAEQWDEQGDPTGQSSWGQIRESLASAAPGVSFSEPLKGWLADCLPSPTAYTPFSPLRELVTTRSVAASGTGNGDSFLRCAAVHTVASMARHGGLPASLALSRVAGPGGELQQSAGERWGLAGEGEGGIIGIECVVVKEKNSGKVVDVRSKVLMDFNCGGMFRAWIDDSGKPVMSIWTNGDSD